MQGYFVQFLAYTMAMVGFFTVCLLTYKKLCAKSLSDSNPDSLSIENVLRINARKQIYIVKAGNERFLVAADTERTTMLAKLEDEKISEVQEHQQSEIALKKPVKKHLGNVLSSVSTINAPIMKRISEKMKA